MLRMLRNVCRYFQTPDLVVAESRTPQKMRLQALDWLEHFEEPAWNSRAWVHVDFITCGNAQDEDSSEVSPSIPDPLQTVRRAELWGVILFTSGLCSRFCWH